MLFPKIQPFNEAKLKVSAQHTLHYEEVGTPGGQAALFLHGGPGLGILPDYRRFFDPQHYHVVLPDQRGAGRSTPYAALQDNTTWHIVEDLETLRRHLGIKQWLVMGGSWGSLLALCYAIRYPQSISSLVLRGVFLGRPKDLAWVYEGAGTAQLFPEHWAAFRAPVKQVSEAQTIAAYYALLTSENSEHAMQAAQAWAQWSAATATLLPDAAAVAEVAANHRLLALARFECHYANNHFFLPSANYVLEHAQLLQALPCHIIHGRYDAICAASAAWDLHQALPQSKLNIVAEGGHSPMASKMAEALINATNGLKT